jgi:hypothetical protein
MALDQPLRQDVVEAIPSIGSAILSRVFCAFLGRLEFFKGAVRRSKRIVEMKKDGEEIECEIR